MDIRKILSTLDTILSGADTASIQTKLDDLVAHYGRGLVEYVRYISPGMVRSPQGTHFLTFSSASGASVELEVRLSSRTVGVFLDLLLERL